MPIISFITDFGLSDEFVGVVHGVIKRVDPSIDIIDVTHGVPRGDVRAGALALLRAVQYLPDGVFLVVIDPGVGTARRAIACQTAKGYFVGPDNGVMAPAVAMVGGATEIVSLENPAFQIPRDGVTFDGRDVFAPAAAVLANGEAALADLGPVVPSDELHPLLLPLVETKNGVVEGEVWWIDGFGNAQTNVSPDDLSAVGLRPGMTVRVRVGATVHEVVWDVAYGEQGRPLIHVDSYGMVALAVSGGRADQQLSLSQGLSVAFSST